MKLYQEASVFDNDQMADDITDASTKAKSYMSFKSGYGLMIADLTGGTVDPDEVAAGTRNILIGTNEIKIRNGQTNLARFGSSVYLDEEGGGVYVGKIADGYYNTRVFSDGMKVYDYDTQIANFGASIWLGNASNFSVDLNGKLTANSATINGAINAKSGSVGALTITSTANNGTSANGGHLYVNSMYSHGDNGTYEYEAGVKGYSNATTDLAFYIKRINKGNAWNLSNATDIFYVNHEGKLYSSDAEITGKITAKSGKIGGWDILPSRIERDLTGSGGLRSGMQNTDAYSATSAVFYAGCSTASSGTIANPTITNWYVRQDGIMYGKTVYLGYTGQDENQYVYVNNTGMTAYVMASGSGTLKAVSVATLRGSVTYPSGIEKPTGTLNLGGAYISGTFARDEGLYKFTTNATFATLRTDALYVGGDKPFAFRLVAKKNQSVSANSGAIFNFDANTPSGYTLLGAVSVYTNHQYACKLGAVHTSLENDQIRVGLSNTSASAITDLEISVRIIYAKSGIFATLS